MARHFTGIIVDEIGGGDPASSCAANIPYIFNGKFKILYDVDPLSMLDYAVTQQGIWNEFLILKLKKILPKNATVFDVGSNVGLFTLPLAKLIIPDGIIYSFEPNSQIRSKFVKNIELNKLQNIIVEGLALQNDPQILNQEFYVRQALQEDGRINYGLSTLKENLFHNKRIEVVKTSTLDNYIVKYGISSIDLIKIDTEGSDYDVLLGSETCIDKFKPIIIYEFSTTIDSQINFKNSQFCFEFLKNKNYTQFRLDGDSFLKINQYDPTIPDSDIICFYKNKIPNFI